MTASVPDPSTPPAAVASPAPDARRPLPPRPARVPGQKQARHRRWTRIAAAVTVVGLAAFVAVLVYGVPRFTATRSLAASQEEGCAGFLDGIARQVKKFVVARGRLPATLAELRDPELDSTYDAEPWDCWNKPIEYRIVDEARREFRLRSLGPDRTPDTADDIHWPADQPWR